MGEVYRAHDERLDRDVAVKLLPTGVVADDTARKHFRKEALALSKLNHPNIETVHDFDSEDGRDFIVTEYIAGESLDQKLASGALADKDILRLGAQLADGLAAAHEQNIIHRDLKPSNLRITPDGRLKILDFGLAQLSAPVSFDAATASVSESMRFAGTLPYMAPEQVRGEKLDARTDIWAAGAVLFEMATGQRPFRAAGLDIVQEILNQAPTAPSTLNRRVSPALDAIILKCLDKIPNTRYQSARELGEDLRRLQMGEQTAAMAAVRTTKRALQLKIAVAAVVAIAAVGTVVILNLGGLRDRILGRNVHRITSIAVLPLENLSSDPQQEYFADGMTDSLITDLGGLTGLKNVIARGSVTRFKGTKQSLAEIARELKVDAIITGAVLRSGGRVRITAQLIEPSSGKQLWSHAYERDLTDVLKLQSEITQAIASEIRIRLTPTEQQRLASVRTVNPQAHDAYLMGRFQLYKETRQSMDLALQYFDRALEIDKGYAPAWAGIGNVWALRAQGGEVPNEEGWKKAKAAATKALEIDNSLPYAHEVLAAELAWWEWNWTAADAEFQRAIASNPNDADSRGNYALFLYLMGRPQEAYAQVRRALELDPYNLSGLNTITQMLTNDGRLEDAHSYAKQMAALQADSAVVHMNQITIYQLQRKYDEAIAEMIALLPPDGKGKVERAYKEGGYKLVMRRFADAGAARAKGAEGAMTVAVNYVFAGEYELAMDWLEEAYAARSSFLAWINVGRGWDPLRSNPRFQDLVRRMNFPK